LKGAPSALFAAALLAGCAHPRLPTGSLEKTPQGAPAARSIAPRTFLASPDDAFWVSRDPDLDRVVAGGARVELRPDGEVARVGWEGGPDASTDPILGALAVPARLGGGYVVWSRARVFFARDFTGDLAPVRMEELAHDVVVRGARAGLDSVIVFTDGGARELVPLSLRLSAPKKAGIVDVVALPTGVAAELDVLGNVRITHDGGASWTDITKTTGGAQQLILGRDELWIIGWRARWRIGPSGALELDMRAEKALGYDVPSAFQIAWRGVYRTLRDEWPWALRDASALALAVSGGAPAGDGTAFGAAQNSLFRVDLTTGKLLSFAGDAFAGALACQPVRAEDAVLFACVVDRTQGYGAYVYRTVDGASPELEKAFSDDGSFVAGDDGALGFIGSCQAEPRLVDPNDASRAERDTTIAPVICVRAGPGRWASRRVELDGETLVGWAPRLDGSAAALALSNDPLPPVVGAPRIADHGGVTVVHVYNEISGWTWKPPEPQAQRIGVSGYLDRRFQWNADGTLDAWLTPAPTSAATVPPLGVTLDRRGFPIAHDVPPHVIEADGAGAFAVAQSDDGALYESVDHGRTWRAAGIAPSPVHPNPVACTSMGCVIGPFVRVGWGDATIVPRVASPSSSTPRPLPRLVCTARGEPTPLHAPAAVPASASYTVSTGWGDTLEFTHDTSPEEPARPAPSAAPPPGPKGKARARAAPPSAPIGTHTLRFRAPFEPFASPKKLDAADAHEMRQPHVVPLLAPSGDVDLLLSDTESELLVTRDAITVLPGLDARRNAGRLTSGGLTAAGGRALVLAEAPPKRRVLEDHGKGPARPLLFLGGDYALRKRPVALARRGDGAMGMLVTDGGAFGSAGIAVFDALAAHFGDVGRVASWLTVLAGDDPRCGKPDGRAWWSALLLVDPTTWLSLDEGALPGMALGHEGLMLVRWSQTRVCLDAIDTAVTDKEGRRAANRMWNLVVRWGGGKERGAVLRAKDLREELTCSVFFEPSEAAH
jgi:hypothetical protein